MAITVTATMSGTTALEHIYLWIRVLTGATETGGASVSGINASGGASVTASLTPNFSNSLPCFAITADNWGGSFTAATNNTIDSGSNDPDDWGAGFGRYTGTVTASSALTFGASGVGGGTDYTTWACYEIPATGGSTPSVDASSPALAAATGAGIKTVTSASFTPPAGSVVVAMVCGGGNGTSGSFSMAVSDGSLTWTQRAGTATVADQDTFVFTATVPGAAAPVIPLPGPVRVPPGFASPMSIRVLPTVPAPVMQTESGALAVALPAPATALAGAVAHQGSLAVTLPPPATGLTGTAQHTESGAFTVTLPAPATSLTGKTGHAGGFSVLLPPPATSLTGTAQHTESGALAVTLPVLALSSLTGKTGHAGGFTLVLPAPATSLTGTTQHTESGALAVTLPVPATALTGKTGHAGSFSVALPVPATTLTGTAQHTESGALAVTLPVLVLALTGTAGTPAAVSGAFVIVLPPGARSEAESGDFALALPAPVLALTGSAGRHGAFAVTLPVVRTALAAHVPVTVSGALSVVLPAPVTTLNGHAPAVISAPVAVRLPTAVTRLTGVITHQGSFHISLDVPLDHLTRFEMFGCESRGAVAVRLPAVVTSLTARVPDPPGYRTSFLSGRWVSVRLPQNGPA